MINNIKDLKEDLYELKNQLERDFRCTTYCKDCPLFLKTSAVCLSEEINNLYRAADSLYASLKAICEGGIS